MKKLISMILSLAMLISAAAAAVPVSAEVTPGSILEDGYKFTDIARSSSGKYVAMAKSSDLNYARLYYSNDGINWTKSTNQPLISNAATIYCNKNSQQQLVWWENKDVFVVHGAASTYTSSTGETWVKSAGLYKSANSMQTVSGDNLILGLSKAVNSTNDLTATTFPNENFTISDTDFYAMSIAAKPADEAGDTKVFVNGYQRTFDLTLASDGGWLKDDENSGNGTQAPYDMVYATTADLFLSVDGSETLMAAKDCRNTAKYVVSEGVAVTGVNANDEYIVVGMHDGKMYYTPNTEEGISNSTVWTEIPAAAGTTACSEPVKNIELAPDGSFIALSETLIYKGDIYGYSDINTIVELGTPQVQKSSIFDGVRLIGGTYSADLEMYMVYGDTTSPNEEGKYQGKIFISTDGGQNWENVYTGITFSYRTFNEDGSIKSYNEVRNGAVWWSGQQQFVISAGTGTGTDTTNYGLSLTSSNGRDWEVIPQATTDLRNYCDLALSGDGSKIYTTNNGRQFRTYTAWNRASMTYTGVTIVDSNWYMNQIVVSDDADPAVLMIQDYHGAVRNNESTESEELKKWTKINGIAGAGYMTDGVFSKNLNQFVVISNAGLRTTLLSKDASVLEQGPIVPGGIVCNAIDTDNETFMLASQNGNIYTAPDTAEFKKDVTTLETVAPAEGTEANTMNVTNVYKAEPGKFIATSSDNTNSDVLIIAKNAADTYEYTKASDNVTTENLEANTTYNISVKGLNKTSQEYKFDMIIAIYGQDGDGELIQVQKNRETLAAKSDGTIKEKITSNEDLPSDAVMKIFIWNSAEGMVPVKSATIPFN